MQQVQDLKKALDSQKVSYNEHKYDDDDDDDTSHGGMMMVMMLMNDDDDNGVLIIMVNVRLGK